jgi:GNAT superfamily N-acetyltransferase
MIFEEKKDNYLISTDITKLNLELIHDFLCNTSYWSAGIPFETLKRSIENSTCFGVYDNGKQAGFARVISDLATIGYLGDVFILPEYRGRGLSKWLMECIMKHPELQGFRRWILITRDAHNLYKKFGYTELLKPQNYMEIRVPDIYSEKPK